MNLILLLGIGVLLITLVSGIWDALHERRTRRGRFSSKTKFGVASALLLFFFEGGRTLLEHRRNAQADEDDRNKFSALRYVLVTACTANDGSVVEWISRLETHLNASQPAEVDHSARSLTGRSIRMSGRSTLANPVPEPWRSQIYIALTEPSEQNAAREWVQRGTFPSFDTSRAPAFVKMFAMTGFFGGQRGADYWGNQVQMVRFGTYDPAPQVQLNVGVETVSEFDRLDLWVARDQFGDKCRIDEIAFIFDPPIQARPATVRWFEPQSAEVVGRGGPIPSLNDRAGAAYRPYERLLWKAASRPKNAGEGRSWISLMETAGL